MAYIYTTQAELQARIDTRLLVQLTVDSQLTDPDNASNIGTSILTAAENAAAIKIDNMLRNYYTVPFTSITNDIKQINAMITLYNLFMRRGQVPQFVQKLYDAQILRLEDLRSAAPKERLIHEPVIAKPDNQGV